MARAEGGPFRHLVRQADLEKENRRRRIRARLDSGGRLRRIAADGHMEIIEGKGGEQEEKITEPFAERVGGDLKETKIDALPNVSPLDKIIVAFAGPLFSFGLAIVFAFIVWGVGKPVNGVGNSTDASAGLIQAGPAAGRQDCAGRYNSGS